MAAIGVRPGPRRMSRPVLATRRPGPLPQIPLAETDEILSSWLSRSAALYHAGPEALLEQIGVTELSPPVLDRHGAQADVERLAVALYSSPEAIRQMSFHRPAAGGARAGGASSTIMDLPPMHI